MVRVVSSYNLMSDQNAKNVTSVNRTPWKPIDFNKMSHYNDKRIDVFDDQQKQHRKRSKPSTYKPSYDSWNFLKPSNSVSDTNSYSSQPYLSLNNTSKQALRETKFTVGFNRRLQSSIGQDRARVRMTQVKEQRHSISAKKRRSHLKDMDSKAGYNVITGQQDESKYFRPKGEFGFKRRNNIKATPKDNFYRRNPKHLPLHHNQNRAAFLKSEGLTTTKKQYSVADFFKGFSE